MKETGPGGGETRPEEIAAYIAAITLEMGRLARIRAWLPARPGPDGGGRALTPQRYWRQPTNRLRSDQRNHPGAVALDPAGQLKFQENHLHIGGPGSRFPDEVVEGDRGTAEERCHARP